MEGCYEAICYFVAANQYQNKLLLAVTVFSCSTRQYCYQYYDIVKQN